MHLYKKLWNVPSSRHRFGWMWKVKGRDGRIVYKTMEILSSQCMKKQDSKRDQMRSATVKRFSRKSLGISDATFPHKHLA